MALTAVPPNSSYFLRGVLASRGKPRRGASAQASSTESTAAMVFSLLCDGLKCAAVLSSAYHSLKALAREPRGRESTTLAPTLELWLVLAAMALFEEYLEFLVSWFPFYYLFKAVLLGMLLLPNAKTPHALHELVIEPAVDYAQEMVHARVLPMVEMLALQHGRWVHRHLLSKAVEAMDDQQLQAFELELQAKLDHVRQVAHARRAQSHAEPSEAK